MDNYFKGTEDRPFHLSVGAVIIDRKKRIYCHYFHEFEGVKNVHILMRETIHPGESLEDATERGLFEELGIKAKLITYIGSLVSKFPRGKIWIEKTTIYFLVELTEINKSLRNPFDKEKDSIIKLIPIDKLMEIMKTQSKNLVRTDLDESKILTRAKKYFYKMDLY